jgi:hypothetical protein
MADDTKQLEQRQPEAIPLVWGPEGDDAVAVKGHGHSAETLRAAALSEGYDGFTSSTQIWVHRVPDRTGEFNCKWHVAADGTRGAQRWTLLEGLEAVVTAWLGVCFAPRGSDVLCADRRRRA